MKLTYVALMFAMSFSQLAQATDTTSTQPGYSARQEALIEGYIRQNSSSADGHATVDIDDLSTISQIGEHNFAAIVQIGSHNRADINQSGGSNNVALIAQNGSAMSAMVVQHGGNNLAMINQR